MSLVPIPSAQPQSHLPLFGIFFVGSSYPIFSSHFMQVDATHWVSFLTELWSLGEEICVSMQHAGNAYVCTWLDVCNAYVCLR